METSTFNARIYLIISQIPLGKITTYGDLAKMAGYPNHARHVGALLKKLPSDSKLPWHRVISHNGKITLLSPQRLRQISLLRSENILVSEQGRVALSRYRWLG